MQKNYSINDEITTINIDGTEYKTGYLYYVCDDDEAWYQVTYDHDGLHDNYSEDGWWFNGEPCNDDDVIADLNKRYPDVYKVLEDYVHKHYEVM